MKTPFRNFFFLVLLAIFLLAAAVGSTTAQSLDQNFPTAVTTSEIKGSIEARDVGDSRKTTYFYTFSGAQGDLFVNIVTNNLTADIDIFTIDGLRPMTKIVVYADLAEAETGRVIYLRRPEDLLLRVQGRTPNDGLATFHIKFAGSFIAASPSGDDPPVMPEIASGRRVNSVGTIIPPTPTEPPAGEEIEPAMVPEPSKVAAVKAEIPSQVPIKRDDAQNVKQVEAEIADAEVPRTVEEEIEEKEVTAEKRSAPSVIITDPLAAESEKSEAEPEKAAEVAKAENLANPVPVPVARETNPLASIKLVILFKDGGRIERPMSEVLRFTIDKGILTVISKDGRIGRYSILDVERTIIE